MRRTLSLLLLGLALTTAARASDLPEAQWQKLRQRFDSASGKTLELARDLVAFRQRVPGSDLAWQAAKLLQQLPAPLDALDRKQLAEEDRKLAAEVVAVLRGHDRGVTTVAFAPDGQTLASASWENTLKLWQLDGAQLKERNQLEAGASQVAFNPRGGSLVTGSLGKHAFLWELGTGKPKISRRLPGHLGRPFATTFSPSGGKLATACSTPQLRIWTMADPEPLIWAGIGGTEEDKHALTSLSFSGDSHLLATASPTATPPVHVWELKADSMVDRAAPSVQGHLVAFPPQGRELVVIELTGTVAIWDVGGQEAKLQRKLFAPPAGERVAWKGLTFSPTGDRLTAGGVERKVAIWNPATGKQVQEIALPTTINALSFAPDGRHLAAAGGDGAVYILRLTPATIEKK